MERKLNINVIVINDIFTYYNMVFDDIYYAYASVPYGNTLHYNNLRYKPTEDTLDEMLSSDLHIEEGSLTLRNVIVSSKVILLTLSTDEETRLLGFELLKQELNIK